mgnify:CR=1 FL=1
MFEAISDELEEKESTSGIKITYKNRSIKWSYNGKIITSKELVRCIIKEQLHKGQSIEMLSKFKMDSAPMVLTSITSDEDRYDILELDNGKVIYVRNYCDQNDVERLINELGVETNII